MEKGIDSSSPTGDLLPPEGRPLILVVDDDAIFLEACTRLLAAMGFEVERARDGSEALELARQRDYRMILLDVKMPNLDGLSCLRQLKAEGCRADVVMVTGMSDVRTIVEVMKAGACDVITKPFQATDLVTRIGNLLNGAPSGGASQPTQVQEGIDRRQQDGDRRQSGDRRRRVDDRRQSRDRRTLSMDPLIAYIREHAVEIHARRDVAAALNTTAEMVSERVHQATGQFFRQYLHTCRIDKAKTLLETTDLPIAEVAARTGFATVQHFSRIFSTVAEVSPRKYRQRRVKG